MTSPKEWTDADRLALKAKNDPPHPCPSCQPYLERAGKKGEVMTIFWAYYPPSGMERYLNTAIDGNQAYYGTLHQCFICEWACGAYLWHVPLVNGIPRIKTEVVGEHIKEHWCDNRRLIEGRMTPAAEERVQKILAERGITREQYIQEIERKMALIKEAAERRKQRSAARIAARMDSDISEYMPSQELQDEAERIRKETVEAEEEQEAPSPPPQPPKGDPIYRGEYSWDNARLNHKIKELEEKHLQLLNMIHAKAFQSEVATREDMNTAANKLADIETELRTVVRSIASILKWINNCIRYIPTLEDEEKKE